MTMGINDNQGKGVQKRLHSPLDGLSLDRGTVCEWEGGSEWTKGAMNGDKRNGD
jgi:hypothetical protein